MAFLDDLRKNLQSLSKASEEVVRKSGGAVELRKLKMEQESLKSELNNCYAQVGRLVVEKMEDVDVPAEMEMLVKQIADCKEAIAENERLIAKKRGIRLCPVCGAKAGKTAVFCDKCGTRLPVEEPEEEEASAEDIFEETAETVKEAAEEAAETAKEAAEEAAETVKETVEEAAKAASETFEEAKEAAGDFVEEVKEGAGDFAEEVKEAAEEIAEGAAEKAEDAQI